MSLLRHALGGLLFLFRLVEERRVCWPECTAASHGYLRWTGWTFCHRHLSYKFAVDVISALVSDVKVLGYCEAQYDYSPMETNQIAFKVGDRIEILGKPRRSRGWWKGRIDGKVGFCHTVGATGFVFCALLWFSLPSPNMSWIWSFF